MTKRTTTGPPARHRLTAALVAVIAATPITLVYGAQAPTQTGPATSPTASAVRLLRGGHYMAALSLLRRDAKSPNGADDQATVQMLGQVQAFVGVQDGNALPHLAGRLSATGTASEVPALPEIVRRAAATRLVILNEDHRHPAHRAFAFRVAEALRPLGYGVLAIEALSGPGDPDARAAAIERRGFVERSDGFYTLDPVFADFIRQSLRLGYRPVQYDTIGVASGGGMRQAMDAREAAAAQRLSGILRREPSRRMLVYVGASHAAEEPTVDGAEERRWLAAMLKERTGINPLTIDQTAKAPAGMTVRSAPRAAGDDAVLISRNGRIQSTGAYARLTDLQVVHRPAALENGRPTWMRAFARRRVEAPDVSALPGETLVQVLSRKEGPSSVPVDQVLVKPGSHAPSLLVPSDAYEVVLQR